MTFVSIEYVQIHCDMRFDDYDQVSLSFWCPNVISQRALIVFFE